MTDQHLPGTPHQTPQPAAHASQDMPHAPQERPRSLNQATASHDVSVAGDAKTSHSVLHASQEPAPASPSPPTPLNGATAITARGDASDAPAEALAEAPAAVVDALIYNLTVPQAQQLFEYHNRRVPAERTIQNYCAEGLIAGEKVSTSSGAEWLINDRSLLRFIQSKPELTAAAPAPQASPATPENIPAAPTPTEPTSGVVEEADEEVEAVIGERRTIAEMLIENARLLGQLETKEAVIAGKIDELSRIEQTNQELRSDREFLREEITDKRRLNQDLKDITSQVLELLEMGFVNRGAQIPAAPAEPPIPAAPERQETSTPSWRTNDPSQTRVQDEPTPQN